MNNPNNFTNCNAGLAILLNDVIRFGLRLENCFAQFLTLNPIYQVDKTVKLPIWKS